MVTLALLFKPSTTPLEISFWARKLHPKAASGKQFVRRADVAAPAGIYRERVRPKAFTLASSSCPVTAIA